MRRTLLPRLWMGIVALLLLSCDEDIPDAVIPQFNQPQAVALVCYDDRDGPLPIDLCANSSRTDARTFALVTQSVLGEVAVVDLNAYRIVDKESRIPYNSFVPVGGLPVDIAVAADGRTAYTVNAETHDISIIDTAAAISDKGLEAARSLHIGGPGRQILIASDSPLAPDALGHPVSDRFAFVTQPTMGRVAVVSLREFEESNTAGESVTVPMGVIAWLRLDAGTLADSPIDDTRPGGIAPYAIVESRNTGSIYVGGMNGDFPRKGDGNYIIELHRNAFIDRAWRSFVENETAMALDPADLAVRRIELGDYTSSDLDIEPSLERWMYVVENESGGVLVIDLVSGELVDVNRWDLTAKSLYSLQLPGRARRLKMFRFDEMPASDEVPGPTTFNGTFAAVATTQASVFVIDVEDHLSSGLEDFTSVSHSLRYGNAWYTKENDVYTPVYPGLTARPRLYGDEVGISNVGSLLADLNETGPREDGDSESSPIDVDDGCGDDPYGFRMAHYTDSYGVYFRCDRRLSRAEDWYLIYQGELGISGIGVMQRSDGMEDAFRDETKSFCSAGLLGPDADSTIWNIPEDIRESFQGVEAYRGYGGDLIEITSEPAPVDPETDCSQYTDMEKLRMYRVSAVVDEQTLRLSALPGDEYAPLPTFACYGQAFSYKVRVFDSWVARGTATGLLKRGSFQNGQCVPWLGETAAEDVPYRNCRVFEGLPADIDEGDTETDIGADDNGDAAWARVFENAYFRLSLSPLTLPRGVSRTDYTNLYIKMTVTNAFVPLRATVGSDITDIALAPNNDVLFVDQSSNGLVIFDMLGAFSIRGNSIR